MAEAVTSRLLAHLDAAAGALKRMLLVAVTQPGVALADVPLHDTLIWIDPYVDEWHRMFARAGAHLNEITSLYRALALATQLGLGIEAALHSYALTERKRRQMIPFPHLGRPRMTPAVTLLLIALHNLLWLARNRRSVAWDEGDGHLQSLATDVVLAPLYLLGKTGTVDVGDLIAITELCHWAVDLFSKSAGHALTAPPVEAGATEGPSALSSALATLAARSSRQDHAEIWLAAAVEAYRPEFAARGFNLPKIMVSISAARQFRLSRRMQLGHPHARLRWHQGRTGSAVAEVLVDTHLADPLDVLRALKHQLIHAATSAPDSKHRHGAAFRDVALTLGMEPRRSTRWTLGGRSRAQEISAKLGPYPRPGVDRPDTVADELVPSLIALATFSPIARIEGAVEGLPTFAGWADTWPGLRQFISAPEAASFRQELVSRLALGLSKPDAADRLASFLALLNALDGLSELNPEDWFEFVAGALIALLGAAAEDTDPVLAQWRLWTQAPQGRSLAYWTGRLARVAEDIAARRADHEYPRLVWNWRDLARLALVPWLDIRGDLGLCLGHWLEGLLADSNDVPTLTVGRQICGFGLAEIVNLWERHGEILNDRLSFDAGLDPGRAIDLQTSLAACRSRLAALPAMQALIGEARHLGIERAAPSNHTTAHPTAIVTLVRYAAADAATPKQELTDSTAKVVREAPAQDQGKAIKHATAYRDRGSSYAAKGQHDLAIQDYDNAIKLNPNDTLAYLSRGLAYAAQGKLDRAIDDFGHAIRLNPKDVDAYINRGASYAMKGAQNLAIQDCTEAIKIDPNRSLAYRNRALSYARKSEHARAIQDYGQAIKLNPKDAVAYRNRGLSYTANGEQDRAISDYNEAIKLDPNYAIAYHNRGLSYAAKDEHNRAIRDFDEAIKLKPDYAIAYRERGAAYAAKGEDSRAIQDYTEAIRLDPKDGPAHYNRGRSYEQRGDRARAFADYNVALTLETSIRGQRLIRDGLARLGSGSNSDRPARPAPARQALQGSNQSASMGEAKFGRNTPCPCGSGKKYKHCHGRLT